MVCTFMEKIDPFISRRVICKDTMAKKKKGKGDKKK